MSEETPPTPTITLARAAPFGGDGGFSLGSPQRTNLKLDSITLDATSKAIQSSGTASPFTTSPLPSPSMSTSSLPKRHGRHGSVTDRRTSQSIMTGDLVALGLSAPTTPRSIVSALEKENNDTSEDDPDWVNRVQKEAEGLVMQGQIQLPNEDGQVEAEKPSLSASGSAVNLDTLAEEPETPSRIVSMEQEMQAHLEKQAPVEAVQSPPPLSVASSRMRTPRKAVSTDAKSTPAPATPVSTRQVSGQKPLGLLSRRLSVNSPSTALQLNQNNTHEPGDMLKTEVEILSRENAELKSRLTVVNADVNKYQGQARTLSERIVAFSQGKERSDALLEKRSEQIHQLFRELEMEKSARTMLEQQILTLQKQKSNVKSPVESNTNSLPTPTYTQPSSTTHSRDASDLDKFTMYYSASPPIPQDHPEEMRQHQLSRLRNTRPSGSLDLRGWSFARNATIKV